MNDDPLLDLFALDLPDLTSCVPDLSLALDFALPDPFEAIPLPYCPPVSGHAPGPWDWMWDRLQDLWGLGGDMAEAIAKALATLFDSIWGWVGGTVRWLWDQVNDVWDWLKTKAVDTYWTLYDILHRLVHQIPDTLGSIWDWLKTKVDDIYWTLYDILHRLVNQIPDMLWSVWDWLKTKAEETYWTLYDILHRLVHQIPDTLGSIWDWLKTKVDDTYWTLYDILHRLVHQIPDTLTSIWDFIRIDIPAAVSGAARGIGDAVTDAFDGIRKGLEDALGYLADKLGDAIKFVWTGTEELIEMLQRKMSIPGKLVRGQYRDLTELVDDLMDPLPLVGLGTAFAMLVVVMILSFAIQSALQTYITPRLLPLQQGVIADVGAELLTVGVVQEALNRGFIDEATADSHLSRAGYSGSAKQALLELRNLLPGPSDLIHMAVREVFNPQLREELTLDAEFPDPFLPWALKLGYTEEWARNYWADHWDLPSPSQGYEMLHRGLIEMPQLINLIKALDYAPVWRQHLIDIAYNPITRVDLRRLYKNKIITEEEVFKGYKAQGYNDQNARYLTDFTKQFYSPDDKSQLDDMADMAATTFRTAYRRHVITRDEALDKIVDAGYTEEVADFLLSIDDAQLALNPTTDAGVNVRDLTVPIIRAAYAEKLWDRARAQQELEALGYLAWEADLLLQLEDLAQQRELAGLQETVIKEQYLAHAIDKAQAGAELDGLKALPERRDLLLQRWELQGAQKTRRLTVAQLQQAYRAALITDTVLLDRIVAEGYNDGDAGILVDLTDTTAEGQTRRLSAAQLQRAYKIGLITDAQLSEQLIALRYSQADAELLVKMSVPTPGEKARQLSVSLLQVALRSGLLTEAEFLAKVATLGYSPEDAALLVKMAAPAPADKARQLSASQLQVGFRSGLVTEAELLDKLAALGYAQADAELLRDIAAQKPEPPPRRLAVANLKALFKAGTIDKAGLLAELLVLGYTDRDAGWLADLVAPEE